MNGRTHSKETKRKLSEGNMCKKNPHSKETKRKLSEAQKGKDSWNKGKTNCYSKETLQKMRNAKLGITPWNKGKPVKFPKVICPHCGKEGGSNVMKRHHFDNCKFKS